MTEEIWKDIPNFSLYEVSNKGNVVKKSIILTVENRGRVQNMRQDARILKPRRRYDGRMWLPLINDQKETKQIFIAHIVAELFVPNPHKYQYVAFRDGNMSNCVSDNLYWSDVDPRVLLDDFKIPDLPNEEWRPIKDYPNYMVSNFARIKSIATVIEYKDGRRRQRREKLKPQTHKDGYVMVRLFNQCNPKGVLIKTHRLVAEAFIPNPDNKPYIDHINTVRDDNRVENLRWVTSSENVRNPITIERLRRAGKEWTSRPGAKKRMSAIRKEQLKDPLFRQRIKEANNKPEVLARRIMNNSQRQPVVRFNHEGRELGMYLSIASASKITKVSVYRIKRCCERGGTDNQNTYWRYE